MNALGATITEPRCEALEAFRRVREAVRTGFAVDK